VKREGFLLQLVNLRSLCLNYLQFTGQVSDLEFKQPDILQPLAVLDFSFAQSALQDLNLLIEQCQLIIPTNQLRSQNVTLILLIRVEFFQLLIIL